MELTVPLRYGIGSAVGSAVGSAIGPARPTWSMLAVEMSRPRPSVAVAAAAAAAAPSSRAHCCALQCAELGQVEMLQVLSGTVRYGTSTVRPVQGAGEAGNPTESRGGWLAGRLNG